VIGIKIQGRQLLHHDLRETPWEALVLNLIIVLSPFPYSIQNLI